jgi:hypothetical protein
MHEAVLANDKVGGKILVWRVISETRYLRGVDAVH